MAQRNSTCDNSTKLNNDVAFTQNYHCTETVHCHSPRTAKKSANGCNISPHYNKVAAVISTIVRCGNGDHKSLLPIVLCHLMKH